MRQPIDPIVFTLPEVKKAMSAMDSRYADDPDYLDSLWIRMPWKPGDTPILFRTDDIMPGCLAIYCPADGGTIV